MYVYICLYIQAPPACFHSVPSCSLSHHSSQHRHPPAPIHLFPSQMLLQKQARTGQPCAQQFILRCLILVGRSGCAHSPSLYSSVSCKSCYCVFVPGCEDSSQDLTCDYVSMLFNMLMHRYNNAYLYTCVLTHTYSEGYFCHCFTKYGHLFTFFCFNNCLW